MERVFFLMMRPPPRSALFPNTTRFRSDFVAKYFDLDTNSLQGQSRGRDVTNARQIAMYLIRRMNNMSLKDIGKAFNRDHSTVMHSLEKVENQMRSDPAFAEVVKEITTNINAKQ